MNLHSKNCGVFACVSAHAHASVLSRKSSHMAMSGGISLEAERPFRDF